MVTSDRNILKALKNPATRHYEIQIECPELTFLGAKNQPDFAVAYLTFAPGKTIIELKSLKFYLYQFREHIFSYERLANTVFDDITAVYRPKRLRVEMNFNPRGGISSTLVVDSEKMK